MLKDKNRVFLSVIIANFNNEKYIKNSLDSVLGQSYSDLEIIVADDASTDRSVDIIKEYENKYPDIVTGVSNTDNIGVSATRHKAILQAKGEYITTLDSDDYYYNTRKLEEEIKLIQSYKKRQNMDVIAFSNIVRITESGEVIDKQDANNIKEGVITEDIVARSCMIPRDFVFKKSSYFEVGGYDPSLITYEDWDLKIRLSKCYPFFNTGIDGTAYRKHSAGLSSTSDKILTKCLWTVFLKNIHTIPNHQRNKTKQSFKRFMSNRENFYFARLNSELSLGTGNARLQNIINFYFNIVYYRYINLKFKLILFFH
jgi:glycosyltransferase involved in cell wall biosynthesis